MKDVDKLWQDPRTGAVITDKQKRFMERITKGSSVDYSEPFTLPNKPAPESGREA